MTGAHESSSERPTFYDWHDVTEYMDRLEAERDRYRTALEQALEWVPEPERTQFETAAFRDSGTQS